MRDQVGGATDQVWMRFACLPSELLGFVYVPPPDSTYFNPTQFSAVQERIKSAWLGTECVIMGDMNTRFGESVRGLPWTQCSQRTPVHIPTHP